MAVSHRLEIGPADPAWSVYAAIAYWLHETAIRLYPQSAVRYEAQVCGGHAALSQDDPRTLVQVGPTFGT